MNQHSTHASAEDSPHEYLVEMTFSPFASVPSPQEISLFTERFVLPTFEAFRRLRADGRIAAGGPLLGATGFSFIARTQSPEELETMLVLLPLWARAQTRVVPLGSFESRADAIRERLSRLQSTPGLEPVEADPTQN